MLFGMLAASHYGAANLTTMIVFAVIGVGAAWGCYKLSLNAGKTL